MNRLWLCGCLALVACSETAKHPSPVDLRTIAMRPVDSLTAIEAQALCEEDARRQDLCVERGMSEQTQTNCEAAVSRCRTNTDGGVTPVPCTGYDLGPPGSCSVTVQEYLACVDAWNAVYTCDNAGKYLGPPAACAGFVERCPRLAPEFTQNGTPPPCATDAGGAPRTSDDIYGFDGCRPVPERFVILGDSIAACYAVSPSDCGPLLIGEYLKTTAAPALTVESHAVGGARIADLPGQAQQVAGGPGPVVIWIYILGNDLALREVSDAGVAAAWGATFAYFGNTTLFPGGVTYLLNTQYSPYDQCPEPLGGAYSVSIAADEWLQAVNRSVFIALGENRSDTVTIDQYPDWLGHGDNANVLACPHCGRDNTSWMALDRIHPNALGYAHMTAKWSVAIDRMYGAGCRGG